MHEAHIAADERFPNLCFRNMLAQVDTEFERVLRLQRYLLLPSD